MEKVCRMLLRTTIWATSFGLATAFAQQPGVPEKKVVKTEADLPRFSYPVNGTASGLLMADDATFLPWASKVGADIDSVLSGYSIEDKATLRSLLQAKAEVQEVTGNTAGALATLDQLRDLQEKPEAKVTSGLLTQEILEARQDSGQTSGPAYEAAFQKRFAATVSTLPWPAAQDQVKGMKAGFQILSPALLMGSAKANLDPEVAKNGSLDLAGAESLIGERTAIKAELPVAPMVVGVLTPYIAAHNVKKPDIWPAREVTLTAAEKLTPVRVAIFDSGVDTSLFPDQLFTDPSPGEHSAHGLAYTMEGKLYNADLQPLTPEQKAMYPRVLGLDQGMDDLQSGIDSPESAEARKFLKSTPPDQLGPFLKQFSFLGQYTHGTHVAGIAVRGNPAARLVVVQFNDSLPDLPFTPSVAWAERFKADFRQAGEYMRDHDVRVVNMSWADSQGEIEQWLNKTSAEKDPNVRKQLAVQIYSVWKDAVEGAIQAAPGTLWVCAAGNSNSNASFLGDVPASLHLPNLITVGAVDQAGEETSFTSYGDTVVLDADGFQVESFVPGGKRLKYSGTSMASPNVVNLAAKLIALDPKLTPEQTIALMEKGAEASADGRLHVIDPKATVAMLEASAKQ